MALRETGSILVHAPRDRVFEVVRARMQGEPGLHTVGAERLESERSTFVLRDVPGGTKVVGARIVEPTFLIRPSAERPRELSDELLAIQKLVQMER